jgi:FkbM family methyltransferase
MKVVFVTPHLSTGGMPEYLRNKVDLLLTSGNDVWVLEKTFERSYRTVRDKIEALLGDRLINIGSNLQKLPNFIESIKPDIIHFEELSDYHFPDFILDQIWKNDREWKIIETLHDSSIGWEEKAYIPDKMIVVSPWQHKNFLKLGIPIEIINHQIIPGKRDRNYLEKLGLDPSKKHVLQVGLWSSRKNQSETIDIARDMSGVEFHFVGSLTENYKPYWENLVKNLPNNCRVWGERDDVYNFYKCMDAVIFPSRGNYGDRETNPLVIRESIAWQIPILLRDLPVYMGMYSPSPTVKFMSDYSQENRKLLIDILGNSVELKEKIKQNMKTTDFFRKKLFDITFDSNENKINFRYLEVANIHLKICVRDIDTEVPIYSFDSYFQEGSSVWCVPIPKAYYDFSANPNFGGFLFDFYDTDSGNLTGQADHKVYNQSLRIKNSQIKKAKFRVESYDPLFVNYEQFFTDKIYEKFFNQIGELGTVIDVGANVGLFTKLALDNRAERVIAVEINRDAIKTFKSIHGESVKIIEKAIAGHDGTLEVFTSPENSIITSINRDNVGDSILNSVECITLNTLISQNNIESISLLKIDVEGAEYDIFRELSIENLKKCQFILIEFHNNYGSILRDDILNKLEMAGFGYSLFQGDCIGEAYEYEEMGTIFAKKA